MDIESALKRMLGRETNSPSTVVVEPSVEWSPMPFGRPRPRRELDEPL